MILSDFDLLNYIRSGRLQIEPFSDDIVRENGLDLRIGGQIARFNKNNSVFDTRTGEAKDFYYFEEGDAFVINRGEHVLLHTWEYLRLPKDLMGFVNLRSSYARIGL
ncbi:MAG: dCTP deaminase, partial [Nitrososphaerota archaeon]